MYEYKSEFNNYGFSDAENVDTKLFNQLMFYFYSIYTNIIQFTLYDIRVHKKCVYIQFNLSNVEQNITEQNHTNIFEYYLNKKNTF